MKRQAAAGLVLLGAACGDPSSAPDDEASPAGRTGANVAPVWVRRSSIRPVPVWARVDTRTLEKVEEQLASDDEGAKKRLDESFARFEEAQPVLSARISEILGEPLDDTALALGYFLTLAIWLCFVSTFKGDVGQVDAIGLSAVDEMLKLDEQIRLSDPAEVVDSDDVVAMEQPEVLAFVHEHLDAALEANADDVDVDDVHDVYRMVLVLVLALSYAVRSPSNVTVSTSTEFTA